MKRTFQPITSYPQYNNHLDHLLANSSILNSGDDHPNVHTVVWDKQTMTDELLKIEGDENGYYQHDGKNMVALIPQVEAKIDELNRMFEKFKADRIRQGFAEPSVMTKESMDKFYNFHAKLTLYRTEADFLKKRLSEYVDDEEKESDAMVLVYGLRQVSKLRGGQLETIDGQKCSETPDGTMIINDERSPYHGMAVPDYRELAKKWHVDRKEADRKKLLRIQAENRLKGQPIPQHLGVAAPHRISISSLPKFPEGVKNYLTESSPKKRVRIS